MVVFGVALFHAVLAGGQPDGVFRKPGFHRGQFCRGERAQPRQERNCLHDFDQMNRVDHSVPRPVVRP
jgi:hypothetical protein